MKASWISWILSAGLHGALLALLLLPHAPQNQDETTIDLVTLSASGGSTSTVLPAPRKKSLKPATQPQSPEDLAVNSPTTTQTEQTLAHSSDENDESTGDSDLASFAGMAPRNSKERYLAGLRDQISRHQFYPQASRSFREEGTVKIRLTLDRSGSLLKVELVEASPYKRLNDAAIRAAAKAAPYSVFPDDISYSNWKVLVPVRFTLAQR